MAYNKPKDIRYSRISRISNIFGFIIGHRRCAYYIFQRWVFKYLKSLNKPNKTGKYYIKSKKRKVELKNGTITSVLGCGYDFKYSDFK